ncbi:odorant receptor Or2-like [Schistocerca americana]|uniref:odorant receptor Or2-like n=1 Tax=Schistocerca americana TaxID=7009 RepID=UPI001F4F8F64|nr:odorant receptor Or2-like [Schistocerca americana]
MCLSCRCPSILCTFCAPEQKAREYHNMASEAQSPSVAAAAETASDLNHLLRPLHWTAVMPHPRGSATSLICYRLYTVGVLALNLSFFVSTVIVLYSEGTADLDVFTLTLSVADTNGTWLFRMAHTFVCERAFHKLSHQVGDDFAEFLTWDDIPMLRAQCRVMRRFTLTYIWFGIIACAYYLVSPVSAEGLPFILALPIDAMQPVGFAVTWLYCTVVTLHAVVMTMVLDSFNVSLISQLRVQLTLLNKKIVSLAREMSERTENSSETTDHAELHYRLEKCILHHQAIIKNADLLESSLAGMLLAQSMSIGASTCFQMFQLATRTNGMQQTGKSGSYLIAMLAELFVYCYFGDDLINESENVALAAYDAVTSLQECPLSIKRSLLLLMHRAQRPLRITAGGFFPLSRESFVSVVNVSYSFFAILRNFKNEGE